MTLTQQRPSASSAGGPSGPGGSDGSARSGASSAQRRGTPRSTPALVAATDTVAGGMFLTTFPLKSIFTDWHWLTVSVFCSLPYLIVVCAFRYRGTARWWHSLIGLAASVLMLLWVFVPRHLYYGVLPTSGTGRDLGDLIDQARQIMQSEHAPLFSSTPLRLLVAAALVGLVCLTDVLGVLLRQPLLAAAPLLEVLAVASATSARSANPFWFATAAVGFLLILLAGTRLQDIAWGPSVDGSAGRLGGGRRMAVTGIIAALVVPLLLPGVPTNLLARAAHHNGTGGTGNGNGQVVLNDLASLRGALKQVNPVTLFQVHVSPGDEPFYIRQEVDDQFTNDGWRPSTSPAGGSTPIPLDRGRYPIDPQDDRSRRGAGVPDRCHLHRQLARRPDAAAAVQPDGAPYQRRQMGSPDLDGERGQPGARHDLYRDGAAAGAEHRPAASGSRIGPAAATPAWTPGSCSCHPNRRRLPTWPSD